MKCLVSGRIHPERADVHFGVVRWTLNEDIEVSAYCDSSQIAVRVNDSRISDPASAFITAEHFCGVVAACLGFELATTYTAEMIQLMTDEETHVFGRRVPALMFDSADKIFPRSVALSRTDLHFRFAVFDYNIALSSALDCAFLCYRALESLKSAYGGWDALHVAIGSSRKDVETKIKKFADPIRHGNWSELPVTNAQQRIEMLTITRDAIRSYLEVRTIAS